MYKGEYSLYSLRKRIFAMFCIISFIFLSLIIRLFYIQAISAKSLQLKAESQWTRDLPITAERGRIYDKNGATLAVSYATYNVYTRYREIEDINDVCSFLSKMLNMTFKALFDKISNPNVSEVLIKQQISKELAKEIISSDISGIFLSESVSRYYPYGNLLSQVLGFTSIDGTGQAGVEAYYNEKLTGTNGIYYVQSDLRGNEIDNTLRSYTNPISGEDLTLSVDVNLQIILEQVLEKAITEQKAKGVNGIIMDAESGKVLAMSYKPSFNLNEIPRDDVLALMEMVKNKGVTDVYEPGSTFKILTMAAALELGVATEHDHFYCGGSMTVDGQKIKCWKSIGHGSQSLYQGFANSCNCVFMTLAQRIGTKRFYEYLRRFGIGSKTGIEISGESNGIMLSESLVKNVDLARIGFGQTVAVTPIQLLTAISSIVGNGSKLSPTILENKDKKLGDMLVSNSTSNHIRNMMKLVVNKKEPFSFIPGYDIGGKTGTAQKFENGAIARGKYVSSFVGSYPASNPKYVLLLTVNEPGAGAYYGSIVAAPYGKEIFEKIIKYFDISPDDPSLAKKERVQITMPNLLGQSLTYATKTLIELGISYEIDGEGGTIINQLPPANTEILSDTTVLICT